MNGYTGTWSASTLTKCEPHYGMQEVTHSEGQSLHDTYVMIYEIISDPDMLPMK